MPIIHDNYKKKCYKPQQKYCIQTNSLTYQATRESEKQKSGNRYRYNAITREGGDILTGLLKGSELLAIGIHRNAGSLKREAESYVKD